MFFTGEDRQAYIDRMFAYSAAYRMRVLAWCLMPNHIHVVALPERETSLAKVFGRLHADYARAVNFRLRTTGHLWQERFYSCAMEETHALQAIAYVEQNPIRAGIVEEAGCYAWSSARIHLSGQDPEGRLDLTLWRKWYTPERWQEVLATSMVEESWEERFREATLRGLPFGPEEYIAWVAAQKRMVLTRRPPGRPPNMKKPAEAVRAAS